MEEKIVGLESAYTGKEGQIYVLKQSDTKLYVRNGNDMLCLNDLSGMTASYLQHLIRQGSDVLIVRHYMRDKHEASRVLKGARITRENKDGSFDIAWREEQFVDWPQ
jgi:hypothetical protein